MDIDQVSTYTILPYNITAMNIEQVSTSTILPYDISVMDIDQVSTSTTDLPYDIIESVLSRLPVKSLLRFKSVCKSWKTAISNPEFAKTHLKQSKKSYSQHLLMWYMNDSNGDSHVVKLENQKLQTVSTIENPWEKNPDVLCYCDGLLLMQFSNYNYKEKTYVLWNPSSRISYKKFQCQHPIDRDYKTLYGLCYGPLLMDYKVIITDRKHYAVFYCRNNYWTEMKETKELTSCREVISSLSFNGDFYWVLTSTRPEEERGSDHLLFEMICFDSKAEKFKKVPMPRCDGSIDSFHLKDLGGNLCLALNTISKPTNQISLMKKVEDSWIEFNVPLPFSAPFVVPVCLTSEDEIILELGGSTFLGIYNMRTKTCPPVPVPSTCEEIPKFTEFPRFVLYQDNMFFNSPNNKAKRKLNYT